MDNFLERLNRLYPNGAYMSIEKYDEEQVKQRMKEAGKEDSDYDSKFDDKSPKGRGAKWATSPLSYEDAVKEYEKGNRIGWVVPHGYCVIDIDNEDNPKSSMIIEDLLNKLGVRYNYNYTSRGIHILFKDSSNSIRSVIKQRCGLNITIDSRANGTGYIVLPCNDPHRKWGRLDDVVDDLPCFLRPVGKVNIASFIGLANGDGRNDALWKWRAVLLQCHKLTDEEIETTIKTINDYLLAEPMTNQELYSTVLRKIDKGQFKVKKDVKNDENPYNEMADEFLDSHDLVSYYNNFYMFNGVYYRPIDTLELERLIHYEISSNVTERGRNEIISFLKLKTNVAVESFNKDWHKIACKNGVINLVTGELEPPNKQDINTIYIPWSYNPDPIYSPRIDQFMKEVTDGDPLKIAFLYQIAGYCLLKQNYFQKFVIFKGEGGTGKSTYMNLLNKLVGEHNTSHIGLSEFDKDYYLSTTVGKLLNIDDDVVDGKVLENTGRFKSIISGEIISTRDIYRSVVTYVPFITCVFSCNKLPRINDKTSGLYRRILLVELNKKVLKPDPLFMMKVTEEDMQYFLFHAVEGIKIALEEGHFRIDQSGAALLQMFKRRQSPLNEWIYTNDIRISDLHNQKTIVLYKEFISWAEENGYSRNKFMTHFTFKDDICNLYDVYIKTVKNEQGVPIDVFYKEGEFDKNFKPF